MNYKFRGLGLDGKWEKGSLIEHEDKSFIVYEGKKNEVNPKTVGMSTRCHDRNGEEIFEGDIVMDNGFPEKYQVMFNLSDESRPFGFYLLQQFGYQRYFEKEDTKKFEIVKR